MAQPEEDEVPEAFVLDASDEALSVWIAVGTLGRNLDARNALRIGLVRRPQNRLEVCGEERIGVVNEMGSIAQEAVNIENVGDSTAADVDAQSDIDGISYLRVSPAEIVIGDSQHQSACLFRFARSPWSSARF